MRRNGSNSTTGIINDYTQFAQDCLGDQALSFELVGFDTEEEQTQALKDGKIDMIFHVGYNPYYAQQNGWALSNTVASIPLAVVTMQDSFDESAGNSVAIEKDNSKLKWYISYNYPTWKIINCDSLNDAEKLVSDGKADCFIARSGESIKYVNDKELHATYLIKDCNTVFAVNKGNTTLLSILNKTLKMIQTSKLSGAVSMYEDSLKKSRWQISSKIIC